MSEEKKKIINLINCWKKITRLRSLLAMLSCCRSAAFSHWWTDSQNYKKQINSHLTGTAKRQPWDILIILPWKCSLLWRTTIKKLAYLLRKRKNVLFNSVTVVPNIPALPSSFYRKLIPFKTWTHFYGSQSTGAVLNGLPLQDGTGSKILTNQPQPS